MNISLSVKNVTDYHHRTRISVMVISLACVIFLVLTILSPRVPANAQGNEAATPQNNAEQSGAESTETEGNPTPTATATTGEPESANEQSSVSNYAETSSDSAAEQTQESTSDTSDTSNETANLWAQTAASASVNDIPLPSHYGPSAGVPYTRQYTGTAVAQNPFPVRFDQDSLFATSYLYTNSYQFSGAAPISAARLQNGLDGLFTTWGAGDGGAGMANLTSTGDWTGGPALEIITTMALDAGHYGRTGKSYFWYWGDPIYNIPLNQARPDGTNNVPVAVFYNTPTDNQANASNNKPAEILFVPKPGSPSYNYWSGGEVHQPTGRIYFSGGEDATVGSAANRFMIYDPTTGNYRIIANPQPKTTADASVNGWYTSSDMALDGEGNIYSTVFPSEYGEKWMIKIEPVDRTDPNSAWVYSKVVRWQHENGANPQGLEIWGMAFHDGKIYFTAGGTLSYRYLVEGDPLTGIVRQVPGMTGNTIFDLAADGSLSAINGTVYQDQNRDGKQSDDDVGVAGQLVQLYNATTGTVVGEQTTNDSGEYSFLLGFTEGATYRVRVVQPQINLGTTASPQMVNAAQTGITLSSYLDSSDSNANTMSVGSFGSTIAEATPPTVSNGGYIDYPAQSNPGTSSAQSLPATSMALYADISLNSDIDVSSVDFGINAEGSWGDAGNNLTNYRSTAADNGPRHISPGNWTDQNGDFSQAVKDNPSLYLGSTTGWYSNGVTNGTRNVNDGVTLSINDQQLPLENQLMAPGVDYTLEAKLSGENAANGTVSAWLQSPVTAIANPAFPTTPTAVGAGTGNTRTLSLTTPTGTVNTPATNKFIRVDATSSPTTTFWNTATDSTRWFAPTKGSTESQTRNWVIDGEVEDYGVRFANGVTRVSVEGVPGSYTVGNLVNATGTDLTANVTTGPELIGSYAVTSVTQEVTFTLSVPSGVTVSEVVLTKPDGTVIPNAWVSYSVPNNNLVAVVLDPAAFSNLGSPDVSLNIRTTSPATITGEKVIGFPGGLENKNDWEIIATDSSDAATVISGGSPVSIPAGSYTIGERRVGQTTASSRFYVLQSVSCEVLDSTGTPKPDAFDEETFLLTVSYGDVASCQVTNAASTISFYNNPVGIAASGWALSGVNQNDTAFNFYTPLVGHNLVARPDTYEVSEVLPAGVSLIDLQVLNRNDPVCLQSEYSPATAAENCWIALPRPYVVQPGSHNVFRITATNASGLPRLPNAGGIGTYLFAIGAGVLLTAAAVTYTLRQQRRRRLE